MIGTRRYLANNNNGNNRELYPTDSFPQLYTYQVDLYIEIDDKLVEYNGDDLTTALAYVNALVSATSAIYEYEVDTHLNVAQIEVVTRYDNAATSGDALTIMENYYSPAVGNNWKSVNGKPVDLHHALLGRDLGGGVAYLGAVCNTYLGFGVSGGIVGNINSLGGDTYWDISVFAHEVGHNFGAVHTHEDRSVLVDTCGVGPCPSPLTTGSATIMSYCHLCGM
jgi:hypothetical protein